MPTISPETTAHTPKEGEISVINSKLQNLGEDLQGIRNSLQSLQGRVLGMETVASISNEEAPTKPGELGTTLDSIETSTQVSNEIRELVTTFENRL